MSPTTANITTVVVFMVLAAAIIVATFVFIARPLRTRPHVIAVLKSGDSIAGTLITRRPTYLEIGGAELLDGSTRQPLDGTVYIDRSNVAFVQAPRS